MEHELYRDHEWNWILCVWLGLFVGGCVEGMVGLSLSSVGNEFLADFRDSRVCRRVYSVLVVDEM